MGKKRGKDQFIIETLKAGDASIAKQLANNIILWLYPKCTTERRTTKTGKEENMFIFSRKETEKHQ